MCSCGTVGPLFGGTHADEKAASAWNARAAVTDEQFAMAVHDGRAWCPSRTCRMEHDGCDMGLVHLWRCSECGGLTMTPFEDAPDYCRACGAKAVE